MENMKIQQQVITTLREYGYSEFKIELWWQENGDKLFSNLWDNFNQFIFDKGPNIKLDINVSLFNHAIELKSNDEVSFVHGCNLYMIFANSEGVYQIDVYNYDDDTETAEPFDGGCCTGSAKNAVYFMLSATPEPADFITVTLLGHEIRIHDIFDTHPDYDEVIGLINQNILDGGDGGDVVTLGTDNAYSWEFEPVIANEDYEMIASENKYLADFVKSLGYTDEQISTIASGGDL